MVTGVYEETGNGFIGERAIGPFDRQTVDVGCLGGRTDNGLIRGEAMTGV